MRVRLLYCNAWSCSSCWYSKVQIDWNVTTTNNIRAQNDTHRTYRLVRLFLMFRFSKSSFSWASNWGIGALRWLSAGFRITCSVYFPLVSNILFAQIFCCLKTLFSCLFYCLLQYTPVRVIIESDGIVEHSREFRQQNRCRNLNYYSVENVSSDKC